jgi:hypothetical protein
LPASIFRRAERVPARSVAEMACGDSTDHADRAKQAIEELLPVLMFGLARDLFLGRSKFSGGRASISAGKTRPRATRGGEFRPAARSLWAMDRDLRPINSGLFQGPLPIIGVRRAIMQCGVHDDAPHYDRSRRVRKRRKRRRSGVSLGFWDSGPKMPMASVL